jgi:hypothetical protein
LVVYYICYDDLVLERERERGSTYSCVCVRERESKQFVMNLSALICLAVLQVHIHITTTPPSMFLLFVFFYICMYVCIYPSFLLYISSYQYITRKKVYIIFIHHTWTCMLHVINKYTVLTSYLFGTNSGHRISSLTCIAFMHHDDDAYI